jgi:hypothetical protein
MSAEVMESGSLHHLAAKLWPNPENLDASKSFHPGKNHISICILNQMSRLGNPGRVVKRLFAFPQPPTPI